MKEEKKKKPLEKHKLVLKKISENIGKRVSVEQAVKDEGYSESYARSGHIKDTRSWDILLQDELPDGELMRVHKELLNSSRPDHMLFPTGPKTEKEKENFKLREIEKAKKAKRTYEEIEYISDDEIVEFLLSVNCKVRKIVHGETARHVYFWSADNMARDKALDKGYKLKSKYTPEEFNLKFKGISKEQLIQSIMSKIVKKK